MCPDAEGLRAKWPILRPVLVAVCVQLAITAATTAVKLRSGRDDADIYLRYATLVFEGNVPYRDFLVEYPPLALPLFLAAGLVVGLYVIIAQFVFDTYPSRLLVTTHTHLLLVGFMLMMVMGVASGCFRVRRARTRATGRSWPRSCTGS